MYRRLDCLDRSLCNLWMMLWWRCLLLLLLRHLFAVSLSYSLSPFRLFNSFVIFLFHPLYPTITIPIMTHASSTETLTPQFVEQLHAFVPKNKPEIILHDSTAIGKLKYKFNNGKLFVLIWFIFCTF